MNTRETAYQILLRVLEQKSLISDHHAELARRVTDERDRRLAVELMYGVCRHRGRLEYALKGFADPRKTDRRLWILLLMGTYQLLQLSRTPDYAAINETVETAKRRFGTRQAGFVNAVLKRLVRERNRLSYPEREDLNGYIEHNLSYPSWMGLRWVSQYGREQALGIMAAMNLRKPIVFRGFGSQAELRNSDVCHATPYLKDAVESDLSIEEMRRSGCYVMNESSQLAAELLRNFQGDWVLDAASSPGGKGLILNSFAGIGEVVFNDISPERILRILENAGDLGQNILTPVASDIGRPPFRVGSFDAVLLDAPCSGTGTISGHPELKWIRTVQDIQRRPGMQRNLLTRCFDLLRVGGILVYAVCSLEREEGEDVILNFVAERSDAHLISPFRFADPDVAHAFASFETTGPALRVLPDQYLDGFYLAVMEKAG